jgi:poly-gamma-glutamate synthesis protein (capsule biosynthesis protein)
MLESLTRVRDLLPGPKRLGSSTERLLLNGTIYRLGDKVDISYQPNATDVANILRNVRRGKQLSDFLVVTNHGHEPGTWSQEPPNYAQAFAHQLIDAGADAYVVHGPHQLRGIEIYKGRPIFYSLGNFIMDDLRTPVGADMYAERSKDPNSATDAEVTVSEMAGGYGEDDPGFDNVPGFAHPVFYQSVIATSRFTRNRVSEIKLYPIDLSRTSRFADRGVPRPVAGSEAQAILERLQRLSEPYGTQISIEKGVGIIRIAP